MDPNNDNVRRSARSNIGSQPMRFGFDRGFQPVDLFVSDGAENSNAAVVPVDDESQRRQSVGQRIYHSSQQSSPPNHSSAHFSTPLHQELQDRPVSPAFSTRSMRSHRSAVSHISNASSIVRRRKLQAELDAEEALVRLEDELQQKELDAKMAASKYEREKRLIQKKLELKNAELDEEFGESCDEVTVSSSSSVNGHQGTTSHPAPGQGHPAVDEWLNRNDKSGNTVLHQESYQRPPKFRLVSTGSNVAFKESPDLLITEDQRVSDSSNLHPVPVRQSSVDTVDMLGQLTTAITQAIQASNPNRQQLSTDNNDIKKFMARTSHGRELPSFSGIAEEWPNFISQFRRSTETCGFSNEENMYRLQKCLRDKAKVAVQAMLTVPENLDKVLETLECQFGRPERIISALIDRAKNTSAIREDNPETLVAFGNAVESLVLTMEHLHSTGHMWNPQLIQELVVKLPPAMRLCWGKQLAANRESTLNLRDFCDWLHLEAVGASFVADYGASKVSKMPSKINVDKRENRSKGFKRETVLVTEERPTSELKLSNNCLCCTKPGHGLSDCAKFKELGHDDKWKFVKSHHLCFCCLKKGHSKEFCLKKRECKLDNCKFYHHRLLHRKDTVIEKVVSSENAQVVGHARNCMSRSAKVLLRVAPVKLFGPKGAVSTHALFDEGSTVTMLDSYIADQLGLEGASAPLNLTWTNSSTHREVSSRCVSCRIAGLDGKQYWMNNVRTVSDMNLPIQSVSVSGLKKKWRHLESVNLPDLSDAKPTILIGQDNIDLIVPREVLEGSKNSPMVSMSKLGWTVHGNNGVFRNRVDRDFTFFSHSEEDDRILHEMVKVSFKTDAFGVKVPERALVSREEERAQSILNLSTHHNANQWTTGLLWKFDDPTMPPSRAMAEHRLRSLERKLDKDSELFKLYSAKIHEYLDRGYARKLTDAEAGMSTNLTWYLPHFGVTNPNKPGKIRLVFDAAAESCGVSLNKMLLTGPDLYNPLPSVLFKFRQRRIAFGGDIKEMFLRVRISEKDRQAQRFLWRDDRSSAPAVYEMTSMIFGATSSPCSAQFVKNENARLLSSDYPEAARAIIERHYMDDYLDSSDTEAEASKLISDVIHVHGQGGFEIRNWVSNSSAVMNSIPEKLRATSGAVAMNCDNIERMLGLMWDTSEDCFRFNVNFHKVSRELLDGSKVPTKREVLRVVMSLFDPMGFLAHFIVKAKILMQDIWRSGVGWDDEIPSSLDEKWQDWVSELDNVASYRVPRCYSLLIHSELPELHIFCDASEKAFSAVAYIRVASGSAITVSLLMGKTRVSPLKPMSIPRLELQAAVMGSRLANTVMNEHDIKFSDAIFWSDSKTVLLWLRSDARKFKPFVAHRVGEILDTSDVSNWNWVPTKLNVADDATRDMGESDLSDESRWLNGPDFLRTSKEQWPREKIIPTYCEDSEEELKVEHVGLVCESREFPLPDINRFSSWSRLIRATAYVLRFVNNLKDKVKRTGSLDLEELHMAELLWWKKVQLDSFPSVVKLIGGGKQLGRDSKLKQLTPIIDSDGVLRVKGRLNNANFVGMDVKSPVILDPKHLYTRLLIMNVHHKFHHQGQETVLNELRQNYWILKARAAVRSAWNECQYCKNRRAKPIVPEMGALPGCRLMPHQRPFTYCGVDYFGPLDVTVGRRREKRWGALFTCLTTRAIHLEVAHSLSTDSAIQAIRRLVCRRGSPKEMYSDNGTNFRGANNELKAAISELDPKTLESQLQPIGVKWMFNPPAAPHMGGAWERLVRSVKTSLHVILKEQAPKDETLLTLFAEVEAVVNSRPLTHVAIDPDDPVALTPSHFLMHSSSPYHSHPPGIFSDSDLHLRQQWRISQTLADHFWKRWIREYLPTLARRVKWASGESSVKVGDNAFLCDPNCARGTWPKGIIVATYPGKDGKVRVVDIKTVTGTYRRPVANIAVLDLTPSEGENVCNVSPGGSMLASSPAS